LARLAIYLRRSSPGEENKNYSLGNQQDDIEKWPEYRQHAVVKTYSDPGGKSYTLNRPIFQRLMADAKGASLIWSRWGSGIASAACKTNRRWRSTSCNSMA